MPTDPHPLPDVNHYLPAIPPTPLVPVRLDAADPVVWCKLEFLNPSGSTKDRIARYILGKAWRQGAVRPGSWAGPRCDTSDTRPSRPREAARIYYRVAARTAHAGGPPKDRPSACRGH